jgi:hypothetical protein
VDIFKMMFWFLSAPLFFSFDGGGGGGGEEEKSEDEDKEKGEEKDDDDESQDDDKKEELDEKKKKAKINSDNAKARLQGGKDELNKILKAAGVENKEQLIELSKKQKEADEEAKSDLEKSQAKVDVETKRADEAEANAKEIDARSTVRLMRAEVLLEAVKEDYDINPDALPDIWNFLSQDKEVLELIEVDDDGKFSGIDDAINKVLENREYLLNGESEIVRGTPSSKKKKKVKPKSKKSAKSDVPEAEHTIGKRPISL